MGSLAAVGVHDDLAAGQTGVAVRASDHELAGRVDVEDDLGIEQGGDPWFDDGPDSRKKNLEDILFDLVVHRLVNSILPEPGNGLRVAHPAEFGGDEFVVLGGNHYGVDPHRVVGLVIFDGELGFGVRPQVRHQLRVVVADAGENLEGDVGEIERQRFMRYYTLGGTADYYYDVLVPDAGYLKVWDLTPYRGGAFLRVPNRHHPEDLAPFFEQPKTFEVFAESIRWNKIMGLDNVGDVNRACLDGKATDLIQIAEALQEKKIVQIAEEIDRRYRSGNNVRIVLITGPTSSGKSTFCKRLSVQLMACGLHPISFSTDDYFVNRVDTPKLPDGSYDFDNFDTVDHDALQKDVMKLISGETVEVPEYNFVSGIREYNGKKLKLDEGSILLIEGLHALNPKLLDNIPDAGKFKIFINTITSISLDDHNCIPTSDNRLLRRIVRDFNKGAFSAQETISNWPNVRRAEVKWIYPYQEDADVLFNSAYLVEFAVLRSHAERILATVPKNCPEYSEAHKLIKFLHYFIPVSDKQIPPTSLMRYFIG